MQDDEDDDDDELVGEFVEQFVDEVLGEEDDEAFEEFFGGQSSDDEDEVGEENLYRYSPPKRDTSLKLIESRIMKELGVKKPKTIRQLLSNDVAIFESGLMEKYDPENCWRPCGIGKVADMDFVREYVKQIEESDGFDVTVYPGPCPLATFIPLDFEDDHGLHTELINFAKMALDQYNTDNKDNKAVPYKFDSIERATTYPCSGEIFHITFRAREADTGDIRTFRAKVYEGFEETTVDFIQLKPVQ